MVTIGAVMALVSRSTVGKIAAMWLPIMTFFALGFEHSVVNMYVIPSGLLLGAPVSIGQALFWNLLPVTLGNLFAGALFTGAALYTTYAAKPVLTGPSEQLPLEVPKEQPATFVAAAAAPPI